MADMDWLEWETLFRWMLYYGPDAMWQKTMQGPGELGSMGPKVSAIFPQGGPPWGQGPLPCTPVKEFSPPDLEPLNDAEAFQLYQDMQQGRFWSESIQDRIAKAKAAGFVFARRRDHGQK